MLDLQLDEQFLESFILRFSLKADDPKVETLVEDAMLEYGGERFFISKRLQTHDEAEFLYSVEAEVGWMRLADVSRPGSFVITALNPVDGLTQVLDGTSWGLGEMTDDTEVYSLEATDASVLSLIWQWAKITRNEVSFNSLDRTVTLLPQVGAQRGLTFRYGRNLESIRRTVTPPQVTRLYPYGRAGLNIKALTGVEYLEDFTFYTNAGFTLDQARANYRKDKIWVDESFLTEADLYAAAQERLAILAQPSVTYEASVVDLSAIMGLDEYSFRCGDTVYVHDELLGLGVNARVSRRISYPLEPFKDRVELAFSALEIPDPQVASARTSTTDSWELFESRNRTIERLVYHYNTVLHRLTLKTVADAEWVVGFKIKGVGVGSSEVVVSFTEELRNTTLWTSETLTLSDGEPFELNFTFAERGLAANDHVLGVRAISDTAGAGFRVEAMDTSFWVLARGTTRENPATGNSVRFDYTGDVQTWEVPEGVTAVTARVVAASGAGSLIGSGAGGEVTGTFPVNEFERYSIVVGQQPEGGPGHYLGGWPNGGNGGYTTYGAADGYGGGGSSHIYREGDTFADSLIVAPAGGGRAEGPFGGGDGGFFAGQDGGVDARNGRGATQLGGGAAGTGGSGTVAPTAGSLGQGGHGGIDSSALSYYAGGGGGGWYGGGGGSYPLGLGSSASGGGGGGGSGWVDPSLVFDVEILDGSNPDGHGYIELTWDTPDGG